MERIHKTNLKTIKYPLVDIRKGLQKKYRGTEYIIDRTRTTEHCRQTESEVPRQELDGDSESVYRG